MLECTLHLPWSGPGQGAVYPSPVLLSIKQRGRTLSVLRPFPSDHPWFREQKVWLLCSTVPCVIRTQTGPRGTQLNVT